ncbi:MAG: hypothetical protein R3E79_28555 [Caldilineaceae bacterium]
MQRILKDCLVELVAKGARLIHLRRVKAPYTTPRPPNTEKEDFEFLVGEGKRKDGLGLARRRVEDAGAEGRSGQFVNLQVKVEIGAYTHGGDPDSE